jgi:hypothetical protein
MAQTSGEVPLPGSRTAAITSAVRLTASLRLFWRPPRACTCAPGVIGRYQKRESIGHQGKKRDHQPEVSRLNLRILWGSRARN